jgi:hypothetical protein
MFRRSASPGFSVSPLHMELALAWAAPYYVENEHQPEA